MNNSQSKMGFEKRRIAESFNRSAKTYDEAAFLHREIGQRIIERLDVIKLNPERIIDVGAATGYCTQLLANKYSKAEVITLDIAFDILRQGRENGGHAINQDYLCADAESLPLADNSIDMIFSCFAMQWFPNLGQAFAEFKRALKPEGLLTFATFGPDTLIELKNAWKSVDKYQHVNDFIDMHDIGDALLGVGFSDPVMDMEVLTCQYETVYDLMHDLKSLGAHNLLDKRPTTMMPKKNMQQMIARYEQFRDEENCIPATYEVIYGQAWGVENIHNVLDELDEVKISIADIKRES